MAEKSKLGHDQNTGSELLSNSWLLPGWRENCGGFGLWWNGDGSSGGIMWILCACQPTKSLWSIPDSTRQCTQVIIQGERCISRTVSAEVCEDQSGWAVGNRIPSVMRTNYSQNPCCNGGLAIQGWRFYYIKTKPIAGTPGWSPRSGNHMVRCRSAEGNWAILAQNPSGDTR